MMKSFYAVGIFMAAFVFTINVVGLNYDINYDAQLWKLVVSFAIAVVCAISILLDRCKHCGRLQ